jgi:hypothetical protein
MKRDVHPIYVARREGDMMAVGSHKPSLEFGWNTKYTLRQGLENYIKNFQ